MYPEPAGLSSSAALEVATAKGFLTVSSLQEALTGVQIAKTAQRAENHFVGVNCGIMDQFISVLGEERARSADRLPQSGVPADSFPDPGHPGNR